MTKLDWVLVIAYGVPLVTTAAEYWWTVAADVAACIGRGVARLRRACPGEGRGRRSDFAEFDKEENRL